MKYINNFLLLVITGALFLSSCRKTEPEKGEETPAMEELTIPADFDFNTARTITLNIKDLKNGVKYDIYTLKNNTPDEIDYSDNDTIVVLDDLNNLIASGITGDDGTYSVMLSIPAYHRYLFLMRNENGKFSGTNVEVTGEVIDFTYTPEKFKSTRAITDVLYAVNSNETKLYAIEVATGTVNVVTENLPYTSLASAVDMVNDRVYIASNKNPYKLGYYDLNTGNFVEIGNLPFKAIRLDYNVSDGLLYISKSNDKLYKMDPSTAQFLQSYTIDGLINKSWGDVAFDENGNFFIATKDGIYSGVFNGNIINATKLTDNSFPSKLTSLAAASNGKLYTYTSDKNKLIAYNPSDNTWNYVNLSSTFKINDLGVWREDNTGGTDTDGDGVPDDQDDYPDDPERAFNNYFPGENEWATLAYEDLWPSKGDYDFNDLVIGYNINQITNADNKVVEIKSKWDIRHNGAGFNNGFAFQMKVDPSVIASVSGYNLTSNYIQQNANGTEAGQDYANIVVMDETTPNLGNTLEVDILFDTPVTTEQLGVPPYNPYIIVDGDVTVEVHLPDMEPTSLANTALLGTEDDDSDPATGRYYKTQRNLPWGINIVYDFVWMKEKVEIVNGYLKFDEWATSGGTQYQDWYKDLPGYRNDSNLDYQNE